MAHSALNRSALKVVPFRHTPQPLNNIEIACMAELHPKHA